MHSQHIFRYVTGEVSSIVMKTDERMIEERSRVEAMETILADKRIGPTLREEIRSHFQISQTSTIDQDSLFRYHSRFMESVDVFISHFRDLHIIIFKFELKDFCVCKAECLTA